MGTLIYDGLLEPVEYRKLYFKHNIIKFLLILLCELICVISILCCFLFFWSNVSIFLYYALVVFLQIALMGLCVYLSTFSYDIKADLIIGKTQVYIKDDFLYIFWFSLRSVNQAFKIKMSKVEVRYNHTYIYESNKRYVYLPLKLKEVIENFQKDDSKEEYFSPIYNGHLDKKVYSNLANGKRFKYLIFWMALILASTFTGFALTYVYNNSLIGCGCAAIVLFVIFFSFLFIYVNLLLLQNQAYGDITIYKKNKEIYIFWFDNRHREQIQVLNIENTSVVKDHLFIKERIVNYVYLPKEVLELITEDSDNVPNAMKA